jgi:hypothetical protein
MTRPPAESRTLAATGAAIPTPRTRRARAVLGDAAACCLCDQPGTHADPDGAAWRWCDLHLFQLHQALGYHANMRAGLLQPRAPMRRQAPVTRGVPSEAKRAAGVATRARVPVPVRPRGTPYGKAAQNAARTHCQHGHPYAGDNVRVNGRGGRVCKTCERALKARGRARRRQEAACAA